MKEIKLKSQRSEYGDVTVRSTAVQIVEINHFFQ